MNWWSPTSSSTLQRLVSHFGGPLQLHFLNPCPSDADCTVTVDHKDTDLSRRTSSQFWSLVSRFHEIPGIFREFMKSLSEAVISWIYWNCQWFREFPQVREFTVTFTRISSESYRRRLRSLLLYLCYVFRALITSLVCWSRTSAHYLPCVLMLHERSGPRSVSASLQLDRAAWVHVRSVRWVRSSCLWLKV